MTGKSFKNREGLLPIGTRVKPSYARLSTKEGTVVEHTEDGQRMYVLWDGDSIPMGGFTKPEIRRAD